MPAPIISVAQMRQWESASWQAGRHDIAVMRQAGHALAQVAERLTRPGDHILILAGHGHNGDDAKFAADFLVGRPVRVLSIDDPARQSAGVLEALARRPALLIDGLFGIGLNRPLDSAWVELIRRINGSDIRILAVDVPSGLNADTGSPMPEAVRAAVTLTFGAPKLAMVRTDAATWVGRLEVASEIGLIPCPIETELNWTLPSDFRSYPPRRPVTSHKGSHGHVTILAGSLGYHGAAVLAARGAQRARPGLVTVLTPENVYLPVAAQLQAPMVRPWAGEPVSGDRCSALLIGPGMAAPEAQAPGRAAVSDVWSQAPFPVILDASALAWLPAGPVTTRAPRILTPHPGEAARMLECTVDAVQRDRVAAARNLSNRFGQCWVVLKGHQTIVASATSSVYFNPSGNPSLGQGGSGDLLAGFISGLLAQPDLAHDPSLALRWAVWQHGAAADALEATRRGWVVEELAAALGNE